MRRALLRAVFSAYRRVISPVIHSMSGSQCIYLPTCSEYAEVAIERFGLFRGCTMAIRRIGRCNPLAKGGFDPVPDR